MQKVKILVGVPGSGKTTIAKEYVKTGYELIERDIIRAEMQNRKERPDYKEWYSKNIKQKESEVTEIHYQKLANLITSGKNIVISDTSLNIDRRNEIISNILIINPKAEIDVIPVICTYEELQERNALRANGVKMSVVYTFWQKLVQELKVGTLDADKIISTSKFDWCADYFKILKRIHSNKNEKLPNVVISDIDGTIACMKGVRKPFEFDKVYLDKPKDDVIGFIESYLRDSNSAIPIFVSGREETCYDLTLNWIHKNCSYSFDLYKKGINLYMRKEKDHRKDVIVKLEILEDLSSKYNILAVFDDRPSVCRMWRDAGIEVYQVGDPYLEF